MGIDKYFWPQSTAVNISCFGYPTEETCDKFMFFVENQREKRKGEKRKKKKNAWREAALLKVIS